MSPKLGSFLTGIQVQHLECLNHTHRRHHDESNIRITVEVIACWDYWTGDIFDWLELESVAKKISHVICMLSGSSNHSTFPTISLPN